MRRSLERHFKLSVASDRCKIKMFHFTPLHIENAQSASSSSLITAPEGGVLNERRCTPFLIENAHSIDFGDFDIVVYLEKITHLSLYFYKVINIHLGKWVFSMRKGVILQRFKINYIIYTLYSMGNKGKRERCDSDDYIRENKNVFGVVKKGIQDDSYVINETLYPQLQSKYNVDNPLYNFRDVFDAYNLTSIYTYFEPRINPGPFYIYLKEIFLYISYFTRKESLNSLNIAMQQVINFLSKSETKQDISNIHKNTKLLNDFVGAESEVFKIALKLQEIHALYRGLMISNQDTSNDYKDGILLYGNTKNSFSRQTAIERLRKLSLLIDENIITVNTVNNTPTDSLFTNIEVNVPEIAPLSKNIKREINKLKKKGITPEKLNELINYITTRNVKKQKVKL